MHMLMLLQVVECIVEWSCVRIMLIQKRVLDINIYRNLLTISIIIIYITLSYI